VKITFDGSVDEVAFVKRPGRRRPATTKGRWVVFRERRTTAGIFPDDILFSSPRIEDCHEFIDEVRRSMGDAAARN